MIGTASRTDLPTGSTNDLVMQALGLPVRLDRALVLPLGGSTFRAKLVDTHGNLVDEVTVRRPSEHWESLKAAVAAVMIHFKVRAAIGVGSIAGPIPDRGPLEFTNLNWGAFDRQEMLGVFGLSIDWLNDGAMGYYGLRLLHPQDHFAVIQEGAYQAGDRRRYAIVGSGLNTGAPETREDGHGPAPAKTSLEIRFCQWLEGRLGYWPDIEDVVSGGTGFRDAGQFCLGQWSALAEGTKFKREFLEAPDHEKGQLVDRFAMAGDPVAVHAARLVFGLMGTWLGSIAVTSWAYRIDISPGILSKRPIREWAIANTDLLGAFGRQGRPKFSNWAKQCTIAVCLANPEEYGAIARAVELLEGRSR